MDISKCSDKDGLGRLLKQRWNRTVVDDACLRTAQLAQFLLGRFENLDDHNEYSAIINSTPQTGSDC
jgi:hypothetical protein